MFTPRVGIADGVGRPPFPPKRSSREPSSRRPRGHGVSRPVPPRAVAGGRRRIARSRRLLGGGYTAWGMPPACPCDRRLGERSEKPPYYSPRTRRTTA